MADRTQHARLDGADFLLELFLTMETSELLRAELIAGEIVLRQPADGYHEHCLSRLVGQVVKHASREMDMSGNKGLVIPRDHRAHHGRVIPDATFTPEDEEVFRTAPPWMSCEGVAMVTEVTDTGPQRDRTAKRLGYARAGIPLYLLIDRDRATAILHSEPGGTDYAVTRVAPFGKPLPLPEPFDFELDTSEFL